MVKNRSLIALMLLAIWGAACNLQAPGGAAQAWIDAPLNGSVVPLGVPVQVTSHASASTDIAVVELYANGALVSRDVVPQSGQTYVVMTQQWTPTQPGTYDLRLRAHTSAGEWSNEAQVTVTVGGAPIGVSPTADVTPPPSLTPTVPPSVTPVVTIPPSITPTSVTPTFTLTENAFCRKGPAVSFPDVTAITSGETVDIKGVSEDGYWYLVLWAKFNSSCWVAAPAGTVNGDVTGVVVLAAATAPPTLVLGFSKPTKVPTAVPTSGGKP